MKNKFTQKKSFFSFFALGFLSALGLIFIFTSLNFTGDENEGKQFPQGYKIISPDIPDYLEFAGEEVPLDNYEIYERIDREFIVNTYFHSNTILLLKRANRWFPVIEPILKEYKIPDDFKYLSAIESGLDNVVSPAGATGFWQLTEDTAERFGLIVNNEIDERYNVEKSTEAACKYLLEAYSKFNNWTLAAASYNFGMNGISNQLLRQKADNYYNMIFGEETSRYIARIVAVKEILTHPKNYGFNIEPSDLYAPLSFDSVNINTTIQNFADFAEQNDINYKILKNYNPWLRDTFITNKENKTFILKMPKKGSLQKIKE